MPDQSLATVERELPAVQPITPMEMLSMAVSQGADIEKLSKLMDLQERWEKNEARKAFVVAMADFKKNAPVILKTKAVSFGAGKATAYKHALAGESSETIGAALSAVGISHKWDVETTEDNKIKVACILTHTQGHSERTTMPPCSPDTSGSKNSIQAVGSTVSYLQRYSLFAATGLVPKDADDDAGGGKVHTLSDSVMADFKSEVDALADKESWEKLWASITEATTAAGDVAGHEELKALMAKKFKVLK